MPVSLIILMAMIVADASVALYRRIAVRNEGEALHIDRSSGQMIPGDKEAAHKLSQIDLLGIGLLVATALYGIVLFAVFLYKGLMDGTLG